MQQGDHATRAVAGERERIAEAMKRLTIHSIDGYEWDCGACHYRFESDECPIHGMRGCPCTEGYFDADGHEADHSALLDRAAVLAILEPTAHSTAISKPKSG